MSENKGEEVGESERKKKHMFELSKNSIDDVYKISKMSDIKTDVEVVRKAISVLAFVVEEQNKGSILCIKRGNKIEKIRFVF